MVTPDGALAAADVGEVTPIRDEAIGHLIDATAAAERRPNGFRAGAGLVRFRGTGFRVLSLAGRLCPGLASKSARFRGIRILIWIKLEVARLRNVCSGSVDPPSFVTMGGSAID